MTQPTAPPRTTSTVPPRSPGSSTRSPPPPRADGRTPPQTRLTGMRTRLIAGLAALTVTVIFAIQNVHAAVTGHANAKWAGHANEPGGHDQHTASDRRSDRIALSGDNPDASGHQPNLLPSRPALYSTV
jgi:hypothetical protein